MLKSKHTQGRPQETQLSPNACTLGCSLTTSVQLCHPKHRIQTLPLPGGFFLLLCLWMQGPEGINMRSHKTHDLLTVQALYPSWADYTTVFHTLPYQRNRAINMCLGAVHHLAMYSEGQQSPTHFQKLLVNLFLKSATEWEPGSDVQSFSSS